MDEPTASLTRHEVDALVKLVSDLKRTGGFMRTILDAQ